MAGPVADKAEAGVIYAPSYQENVYQGRTVTNPLWKDLLN